MTDEFAFSARRFPLERFRTAIANSEDLARRTSRMMFPDMRAFRFLDPERRWMRSNSLYLNGVRIGVVGSSGHRIRLNDELNHALLLPFQGEIGVDRRSSENVARPGQFLSIAPGERRTTVGRDYLGIVMQLPVDLLARRAGLFDPDRHPMLVCDADAPGGGAGLSGTLWRHVRCLVDELDRTDALVASERLARSATNFLADLVVEHWLEAISPAATRPQAAAPSARLISRAEEFMRANVTEPITIAEVAAHLQVSVRSLQAGFRRLRSTSPREFLAARRLERARVRLLDPGPGESVTSIVHDCGVGNPGRFAGIYRSVYGETPSQTLNASRNSRCRAH